METMEVKPLIGFGELKFGSQQSVAENIMGEPEEIEDLPGEADESDAEVWNYWKQGHTLFFDKELQNRCVCCETDNNTAKLYGKKIFALDEAAVVELMKSQGFKELDTEDEEWGERRVSFSDAVMDFYFENDKLISISWGVMIDLETNEPQWP